MNYEKLSKEISYALRHAPHKYGFELDEYGWVNVDLLITAFKEKTELKKLDVGNIEEMIKSSSKKRHQLENGKIRALYGHSVEEKIKKVTVKPPDVLYHGTAHKFIENIKRAGLISKGRQYVHLSEDMATAIKVGKRRDNNPVLLEIDAKQAYAHGILFYHGNDDIWLSDNIPIKYIRII